MNPDLIKTINREVYRRFPEVKDKRPKITKQSGQASRSEGKPQNYLLIYQGQVTTADQKTMTRLVRVVANEEGKILKISTSR